MLWEKNPDNVNDTWKAKPKIAGHFWLNQTPDIISRYKRYGKDGFEAKDSDERNDKIAFWKKMLTDLKNLEKNPEVKPEFFLKEFKNFFYNDGFWDRNDWDIIARIRLIKKVAAQKGKPMVFNDTIRWCKVISDKKYGDKEVNSLLWFLFKGTILSKGVCQPPEEFEKVLDFFQNYFEKHFDEISKEDVLRRVFSSAPHSDEIPEEYIVPWDEYTLHVQKEEKYIQAEEDVEETWVGILTWKDATKWKRNHFKSDYFVNQELVSMEKLLKKIGVVPPMNLSKPDKWWISITPNKRW